MDDSCRKHTPDRSYTTGRNRPSAHIHTNPDETNNPSLFKNEAPPDKPRNAARQRRSREILFRSGQRALAQVCSNHHGRVSGFAASAFARFIGTCSCLAPEPATPLTSSLITGRLPLPTGQPFAGVKLIFTLSA